MNLKHIAGIIFQIKKGGRTYEKQSDQDENLSSQVQWQPVA